MRASVGGPTPWLDGFLADCLEDGIDPFSVMNVAKRRLEESTITDFSVKANDDPVIVQALTYQFMNFNTFIRGLANDPFKEFVTFVTKQKNSDRVVDWVLSRMPEFKSIKDWEAHVVAQVELRSATASVCMKSKVCDLFEPFILRNGRWDLESLKMELAKIHGQRFPPAPDANMVG
jgi:hypothetical protein